LIAHGHDVVALDLTQPAYEGVDNRAVTVTDYDALLQAFRGCQGVVHLAAIPSPEAAPDHVVHNNNVTGSYNALRAAAEHGIRYVVQASSINALGSGFSRRPKFDYLPLDERHVTRAEDPYSLSKWLCEQQADAIARRFEAMTIATLRFHWVVPDREFARANRGLFGSTYHKHLWGYVPIAGVIDAILLSLQADFRGHETFYTVAAHTAMDTPTRALVAEHYPGIPLREDLPGTCAPYDCRKAVRLLNWKQPE
jgi:UDP-glucose 4-epimerase